jgi:hypothetical protein
MGFLVGYVTPQDYGASGNGTSDDLAGVQGAINAVQSAGGGTVFFPVGTYLVSGIPTITGSGISIRGAGWSSVIKLATSALNASGTTIGLWVNGGSNVLIEELCVDGNFASIAKDGGQVVASTTFGSSALGAAIVTAPTQGTTETWTVNAAAATATSAYAGIPFVFQVNSEEVICTGGQGTTSWTVRRGFNSTTTATHSNGTSITNTQGTLFDTVISTYGINSPKDYLPSTYAGGIDPTTYLKQRMPIRITGASNVTVRNCLIQNSISAGILADAASVNGCTDVLVTNNRVKLTWDNGVYCHQGVQYATVANNEISDTTYNGVSAVYSDHILVTSNNIRLAGPSYADSGGVQINGSSNCEVMGNLIDQCQFYGVEALSTVETNITGGAGGNQVWASNTIIANNSITGCHAADFPTHTSPGVNVFGASNTAIIGNTIDNCDYGVSMGSKSSLTQILNNRITRSTSLGINVGNSADVIGTIIRGNLIAYGKSHGVFANAPTRIEGNTITANGSGGTGMGVNLSSPPTGIPNKIDWVLNNTITGNADSGLYANAGSGNIAYAQGNLFSNDQFVLFNDASITFNSTTMTSATASFTNSDVGLPIVLMDQGSGGVTTATTVASVTNSTTIVLASAAQATETGVTFWIGRGVASYTDGSTTNAASSVLTSATAGFTSSDAGKLIVLLSQSLTPSVLFVGTIASFTNSTTVTLSGPAGLISACTLIINRSNAQQVRGINNGSGLCIDKNNIVWGIPEVLTGGNTFNLQARDRWEVYDAATTLDRTARYVAYVALTAARTLTLADATTVPPGALVVIKDEAGTAGSNTITVATQNSQTIDGASTKTITSNYGLLRLTPSAAQWFTT